ncbi:MAG: hypothetical protein HYX25_09600, partial [Candidatus Solibacter usitatus]|nr:hypothetical protein [Candidatus Solibacter usitatus]
MPLEPFLNAPRQTSQLLLSRRGILHAGLVPLLALRGSAAGRTTDGGPHPAVALRLEGSETGWHGLAISPDGSTAYVSFKAPDVVLVVDLIAGRLRSAIDLAPAGVMVQSLQAVLSSDGKLLFVVNQGTGNIAVIDTAAERVVKVLPFFPGFGDSVKASPTGKVYIALLDGRLVTVSCADLSYTTTSFGVLLDSIVLSAKRADLVYAVSFQNGQDFFHAFNLATGREERRMLLPKAAVRPQGGIKRLLLSPAGDVAHLGWMDAQNYGGFGNITSFDLTTFVAGPSTAIQDGVTDFAVHPGNGLIYAVGDWTGSSEGREMAKMFIVEFDPVARKVTQRFPISPSGNIASIQFDPANPRFVYSTEGALSLIRKVDTLTGGEVMRVRFFPGVRFPTAGTTNGSLAYITCYRSPLIHKLDLNTGKLAGTLDLPGLSGSGECAYYDGKLYVGDYTYFRVINAADGSLIFSRQIPDGLALSNKIKFFRNKIAATAGPARRDPDRIVILDAGTLDILATFRLELPSVAGQAVVLVSPDGAKLYVQQGTFGERTILHVLDSATLRVLKRFEPPTTAFQGGAGGDVADFDEQKRIGYFGGFCSIYKIHMDTDEFLGMLNVYDVYKEMGRQRGWPASALSGIYLSAAKDRLLITSYDGECVYQYDLRNEKWIPRVVRIGLFPGVNFISPDRKYQYTVSRRADSMIRFDTTAAEVVDVTPIGGPVSNLGLGSLRHGASFQSLPVVPGCVLVIRDDFGFPGEIGPSFLTSPRLDASGRVATELAGTKVLFDGVPAPILYTYASQVGLVVPFSVAGKRKVQVQLIVK